MDYFANNYRFKKIKGRYFITTDHGSFCFLSEDEFRKFRSSRIDPELRLKLVEREIILDSSNLEEAIKLTGRRNSFLFSGASLHIIITTLKSNMNCIYLPANEEAEEGLDEDMNTDMDIETAKQTVDFIFQSPSKGLTIEMGGGEPLLNWEVVRYIVDYANEKNKVAKKELEINIFTNLIDMTNERMDYLIGNNVNICTSLDGPKELHDFNRKCFGGSSYEIASKWIKKIRDSYAKKGIKNKKIHAWAALTKKSLSYPKEIVDEYANLGLDTINLKHLNTAGMQNEALMQINYSAEEYLDFWKRVLEYIESLQDKGIKINEGMSQIILEKVTSQFDPNYFCLRSPCGAVTGQLAYNYNGDIYSCNDARRIGNGLFILGNVKKDKYCLITTCNKSCTIINASLNEQFICDMCVYKPYCGVCPVRNYAEQGTVIAKIPETKRCKIQKQQFDFIVEKLLKNEMLSRLNISGEID
jgi:His-Xaa-Ser system radical SAM maturase HxsB